MRPVDGALQDHGNRPAQAQRGLALAFALPILAVVAVVSLAAFAAAVVEQRMAANVEYRERAFQAAEFAIAQAINAGGLGLGLTFASPKVEPAIGDSVPIAGSGADAYSYRLYFAASALPDADAGDIAAGVQAFHFVIEATGYSARGAQDLHVQGFRVIRPADWTADVPADACPPDAVDCDAMPYPTPERTYWVQPDAE